MADIEAGFVETDDLTPVNRGMEALAVSPDLPGSLVGKPTPHPETSASLLEYKCLEEDEIRLIKILPDHWDEPLVLELDNHHLTTCPPYLALSYAWGDMTTTDPAIVNGQTHPIGQSLCSALRRLRSLASSSHDFASSIGFPLDPVYVWADWLSLNQADDREKEVQIPRMGHIYGKAARVLAWLGENNEDEESGCKLLMDLARVEAPDWQEILPWKDARYREALFQVMGDRTMDFVNILQSLLIRPFFHRLWIIQELSLPQAPPIMLAGGAWIGLIELYTIWACAVNKRHSKLNSINFTAAHYHIYGLLSIACAQELPPNLRPDYEAPYQEVYKTYTRFLLEQCGDISILNRINCHFTDMPSWVPDYVTSPMLLTNESCPGLKFLPGDRMQIRGVLLEYKTRYIRLEWLFDINGKGGCG
ncbi:heterokaryon incompatibility protein-domain-containing protein [Plectosphaerella plurivora]|uniref:Heterokaryon incompatibility protein-domain-containing protein n=1 Tax=Plectosphaerella plurivora TaxID=936078 RepID=A0A9P8V0R9_9PEZI|nr:heterokaryon incompatibility protein-domain-containing protein [Plectosphaerella plurivora]